MNRIVWIYKHSLEVLLMTLPLAAAAYLQLFQDPGLKFDNHAFHMVAIGLACVLGGFVSFVTWRCYQASGEPFLRYVTLAFLGFTVVYTPHGLLTPMVHTNMWAFLLYGPVSRLVMAGFMFLALSRYGLPADPPEQRRRGWGVWIALMAALVPATFALAHSPLAPLFATRLVLEGAAIGLGLLAVVLQIKRRIGSPLMLYFLFAQVGFAESCGIFLIAKMWNHQWWWAHAVFAGGFMLLSYGVVRAWLSTRAFATVYSPEEMIARIAAARAAEEVAVAGEAQLRALLGSSPDGVIVLAEGGAILFRNDRLRALLAARGDGDLQPLTAFAGAVLKAEERPLAAADGRMVWALLTTLPIQFAGQKATVVWITDISGRKLDEERLREALLRAEESDRLKTAFLATMGHELRTPLNHVLGFSEAMHGQMFGPLDARYADYAGSIHEAARSLSGIVEAVFDLTQIEAGVLVLREQTVAAADLVEPVIQDLQGDAAKAGLMVDVDLPGGLPSLHIDVERIRQVLRNVVGNAVKFTPPGGRVRVTAQVAGGGFEIVTSDTGIGITAEDLGRILDPFSQADQRLARRYDGCGLGLPLARRLMQLHQGELTIDSSHGQGTTVTLSFPASRVQAIQPVG